VGTGLSVFSVPLLPNTLVSGREVDETNRLVEQMTPLLKRPSVQHHNQITKIFQQYERDHPELKTMLDSPPSIVYDYLSAKYGDDPDAAAERASRPSFTRRVLLGICRKF
jgi:hypothetical protein